jgi:hypothetical protein
MSILFYFLHGELCQALLLPSATISVVQKQQERFKPNGFHRTYCLVLKDGWILPCTWLQALHVRVLCSAVPAR